MACNGQRLEMPKIPKQKEKKITSKQKIFICRNIAAFKSDSQIVKLLKEEYNQETSIKNISKSYRYNKKWQAFIKTEREKYLKNLEDVPLIHLKNQVIALSDIYTKAIAVDSDGNRDLGAAIKAIDEIATLIGTKIERKSIEGELLVKNQEYDTASIEDLERRRDEALERFKMLERQRKKAMNEIKVVGGNSKDK